MIRRAFLASPLALLFPFLAKAEEKPKWRVEEKQSPPSGNGYFTWEKPGHTWDIFRSDFPHNIPIANYDPETDCIHVYGVIMNPDHLMDLAKFVKTLK